ncbi:hypothetical protein PAXINDRAFT_86244, partial [Paxillus involutus ATCC 200175]
MSSGRSSLQTHCLLCLRTIQDPLVHHGRHFGRAVHTFCNVQTLIVNGLAAMAEGEDLESMTTLEHKELSVFKQLVRMVPGIDACL